MVKIQTTLGVTVTEEQRSNADSIYNLIRYGSSTGTDGWIPGAEVLFIGADGFCAPVGSGWESRVTSEFSYRSDPFTGQTSGHTGIDIAVPTGTPIRAALPGVVATATYDAGGYGYYVKIDHGNGMMTLYAHNSKLLVKAGNTVEAGKWYRCPVLPAGPPAPICFRQIKWGPRRSPASAGSVGERRSSRMSEFSPFWAETRDMALATTRRRAGDKKRQAERLDAFLRRVFHSCPQCGQFQGVFFDAFQSAAGRE